MLGDLKEWGKLHQRRERHAKELEEEREQLAAVGVFANRLEKIREKFSKWPEDVAEKYEELKLKLEAATLHRQQADETLSQYDLPRRKWKFSLKPRVFFIFLVAFLASVGAALEWKLMENTAAALLFTLSAVILVIIIALFEHVPHVKKIIIFL